MSHLGAAIFPEPLQPLNPGSPMTVKIAYFAHDLSDPAVHRRIRMLLAGGASVVPIGFRRTCKVVDDVEGLRTVDLGRTADGMLGWRVFSVAAALGRLEDLYEPMREVEAVVARNLEMLVLAARARHLHAPRARLVYECLDIHRLLLSKRVESGLLRLVESKLWRDVDLLLTSSPAFVRNYFQPRGFAAPIRLVENKMLLVDPDRDDEAPIRPPPGPPWRIGWFGMIRCRRSLEVLKSLTRKTAGMVEVVIRGRPSGATLPDIDGAIGDSPHVRFRGLYSNPQDLASIYGEVHFNWAIDCHERGGNSNWLLPNRIYEGSAFGTVPMALAGVETGRWLTERGVGVVLEEPLVEQLAAFFRSLDAGGYGRLAGQVGKLPRADLVCDRADCSTLVEAIRGDVGMDSPVEPYWRESA
jgi:succinoglycan biosynthesis protein ExoL